MTTTKIGFCPLSCLRQGLFLLAAAHTRLACSELLGSLLSLVFNLAVGTLGYKSVHHAQLSVGFRDLKSGFNLVWLVLYLPSHHPSLIFSISVFCVCADLRYFCLSY